MWFIRKLIGLLKKPPLLILISVLEKIPFMPVQLIALNSFSLFKKPEVNVYANIRIASIKDIKSIDAPYFKQKLFIKRFESGEICLLAIVDNVVAGYEWFSVNGQHTEERYDMPLIIPENSIYAYDAYVMPEFRRRGVLKNIISHSFSIMDKFSKIAVFSYIDLGNNASEIAHIKLGFKKEGLTLYLKIRGLKHICIKKFNTES